MLFHFATRDKIAVGDKITQERYITIPQRYSKVEFTFSSVIVSLMLAFFILKNRLNRFIDTLMYHRTFTSRISVVDYIFYFCFQNGSAKEVQLLPAAIFT